MLLDLKFVYLALVGATKSNKNVMYPSPAWPGLSPMAHTCVSREASLTVPLKNK